MMVSAVLSQGVELDHRVLGELAVRDLFGGSGSTLIGCEQTGRKACLMEMDELYCDVIVKRWEQFTGRKAERDA